MRLACSLFGRLCISLPGRRFPPQNTIFDIEGRPPIIMSLLGPGCKALAYDAFTVLPATTLRFRSLTSTVFIRRVRCVFQASSFLILTIMADMAKMLFVSWFCPSSVVIFFYPSKFPLPWYSCRSSLPSLSPGNSVWEVGLGSQTRPDVNTE